jgi:hypothetical protein
MAGEFTTELGCTVRVIPPPLAHPTATMLVLKMDQPGDNRTAMLLLTDDEREKLKTALQD